MIKLIIFVILLGFVSCFPDNYYTPAYWDQQESIWLSYPSYNYLEPNHFQSSPKTIEEVIFSMIEIITKSQKVSLVVNTQEEKTYIANWAKEKGILNDRLRMFFIENSEIWARDYFGTFVVSEEGTKLELVCPGFNYWGYAKVPKEFQQTKDTGYLYDTSFDTLISNLDHKEEDQKEQEQEQEKEQGEFAFGDSFPRSFQTNLTRQLNIPIKRFPNYFTEGGDHSFNGDGLVIASLAVEKQRNPDLQLEEIENNLKRIYNLEKIIWVNKGPTEDYSTFDGPVDGEFWTVGTGGHVDEHTRFVSADTILVAQVTDEQVARDPLMRETQANLEENLSMILNQTDQYNNPFKVIKMPVPEPIFFENVNKKDFVFHLLPSLLISRNVTKKKQLSDLQNLKLFSAASYMNFVIGNEFVLVSKYYKDSRSSSFKQTDEQAKLILQQVFPKKSIYQLFIDPINAGGGGMNCITQQQPSLYKRELNKH
ncbi:agmatine deiminase-related [Anaeramoeba flamelloides]|uniref:Agmatine deiminase-related n=1 Tax=Anaeramoeba flamelloides TaxID=1746091 RepID=A0AAV7YWS9_9EUKA|nr:agmatine deiminase-related [Anaeramoeba flamelloides]